MRAAVSTPSANRIELSGAGTLLSPRPTTALAGSEIVVLEDSKARTEAMQYGRERRQ